MIEKNHKKYCSVPKLRKLKLLRWLWNIDMKRKSSIGLFVQYYMVVMIMPMFHLIFWCNKETTSGNGSQFWWKVSKNISRNRYCRFMLHILYFLATTNNKCWITCLTCNDDIVQYYGTWNQKNLIFHQYLKLTNSTILPMNSKKDWNYKIFHQMKTYC